MKHFNHILFPVDFSDRCRAVRPFVRALASRFHSRITLLHVIHIPAGWYGGMEAGYPMMFDIPAMEQDGRGMLLEFFGEAVANPVEYAVKSGDPAIEITRFAEANGVDLILMPTHGYGKFRGLLLGSVTAKVLHDAKCPVWTTAHTDDPELPAHLRFENVMCAIDLTGHAPGLIREAASLAEEFKARLRLVHAAPGVQMNPKVPFDDGYRGFLIQNARDEIAKLQLELGTNFEVCIESGPVSEVVRNASLHHEADLVILGRGTASAPLGRLRSNTYGIIREAPCPVLSV